MGCTSSSVIKADEFGSELEYMNYLKTTFPSVNTVDSSNQYAKFIKNSLLDLRIKDELISKKIIGINDMLTTDMNPFNVFARFGACVMPTMWISPC